jgi:peptidoglycan/LPS O-acetylase OafA/YrhL
MFKSRYTARVEALFSDQFEEDGASFLYRKSMKGAPIRVSAKEREDFIALFGRQCAYLIWGVAAVVMIGIVIMVVLSPDRSDPSSGPTLYVGTAAMIAIMLGGHHWIWTAPARALAGRPTLGVARDRREMRQLMLSKMTYQQLGFGAGTMVLLMWNVSRKTDIFHGWGILWLVFAGVVIIASGVQAFRKWRRERT